MSSLSASHLLAVLVLFVLLPQSALSSLVIDRVTGCPRTDLHFTYDCQPGLLVTVTSLSADFPPFHSLDWWMAVDQQLCANNSILSDYAAACTLPALPDSSDPNKAHELAVVWRGNTTAAGSASINVFYGRSTVASSTASSTASGDGGDVAGGTVLGMSRTVGIAVLSVAVLGVLSVLGALLWQCRGGTLSRVCVCIRKGSEEELAGGAGSYGSLE